MRARFELGIEDQVQVTMYLVIGQTARKQGMLRDLLNFRGVNWWTLLGGIGLNFVISTFLGLFGTYLASNEVTADFYARFGAPLMVLAVFGLSVGAGWIVGKIADDEPVKHAFLSSLGAIAPLFFAAVMTFNPMLLMMAAIAAAGNLNGGMLAMPRRHRFTRDDED